MPANKTTYVAAICEAVFLSKKPNKEGDSLVFMFQGTDYIPDYDMKISPETAISKLSDEELHEFKGSHKFTISADRLAADRYKELVALKPRDKCMLEFGFMPGHFKSDGGRDINFASMTFIGLRSRRNASDSNGGGATEQRGNRPPAGVAA